MKSLLTTLCFLLSHWLTAQTVIRGKVTEAGTDKPLPFATVYINTTTRGTTADENGSYRLTGIPAGTVEVVASYVGYKQARQVVRVRPDAPATVNLELAPTGNALTDVTVTAKRSRAWERMLRTFKNELLGESPWAGRCVLTNPEAVILTDGSDGHLRAKATEPLVFDHNAFGYRIYYDLLSFDFFNRAVYYGGATRFEEMKPESPQQQRRWQRNRQQAYEGSTRHLLTTLLAGTYEQEGYMVFKSNINLSAQAMPSAPVMSFEEARRPVRITPDSVSRLFRGGELGNERVMILDKPLEIFNTRLNTRNSPYPDMPFAYSLLYLPRQTAIVTTDGWVSVPNGMEIRGHLSRDRLANLLPADWRPMTDAIQPTEKPLAEGTLLSPDARLDSIKRDWRIAQKSALPLVFLHTDKTFYTTGDNLWFSAYVLNPTTYAPLPNRLAEVDDALHLDWINASGRVLRHRWVPLKNGRANGAFRLSDSLQTGVYTLRAYTEAGRMANRPAFERTILVSNGLGNLPAVSGKELRPNPVSGQKTLQPNLQFDATADTTQIQVRVVQTGPTRDEPVYLTLQSRERFVGNAKIKPANGRAILAVPTLNVPMGLIRLTLFDSEGQPNAERMVWLAPSPDPVRLTITPDKARYQPRDTTSLQLRLQTDEGEPLPANVSISITDADQLPPDSLMASFRAHLFAQATRALPDFAQPTARRDTSVGMVVRGRVLDRKGQPVPKAGVLLTFVTQTESFARSTRTDAEGRFRLETLVLTDSAQVTARVVDEAFKPLKATVRLDNPGGPQGEGHVWPVDTSASGQWWRYVGAIRAARLRQAESPEGYRQGDARQLREVTVRAIKPTDDREARRVSLHGTPDRAVTFDEKSAQYGNVYEMLRGRVAGVQVTSRQDPSAMGGYTVIVRGIGSFGSNNAPLFIWDGQYIDENETGTGLLIINPAEIERIEVVSSASAAIYGARGGAGVVAFYSRKSKPDQVTPGAEAMLVMGFPRPVTFVPTLLDPARTDRRDVLFWTPQQQTDTQGNLTLRFPLSDVARTLRVTVQGISTSGLPVSVERVVKVQ
ncbi:MAG: hypothetical protein EAZ91_15875 [Cytophagales bacterium]|nr:MAG: hypothetical protein EAZ91_15875 [Cytophagales bacterium]